MNEGFNTNICKKPNTVKISGITRFIPVVIIQAHFLFNVK